MQNELDGAIGVFYLHTHEQIHSIGFTSTGTDGIKLFLSATVIRAPTLP